MEIKEIELFDLYGNGTLVMKTNVDAPTSAMRYAWYVKKDSKLIMKGVYQKEPFTACQLESRGLYTVKAFVRNGKEEKVEQTATFRATAKTSPALASAAQQTPSLTLTPKYEQISGAFWQFRAEGAFPENAEFAWYLFREGEEQPVHREMYPSAPEYTHKFEEPGRYHVKVFVKLGAQKKSADSACFEVAF
ncbi:MAG: PKD domain-containing protein [Oscillospiraceae bacterium]|nr:PKD domain-containing protein [Oscillospiraceae bacterium]